MLVSQKVKKIRKKFFIRSLYINLIYNSTSYRCCISRSFPQELISICVLRGWQKSAQPSEAAIALYPDTTKVSPHRGIQHVTHSNKVFPKSHSYECLKFRTTQSCQSRVASPAESSPSWKKLERHFQAANICSSGFSMRWPMCVCVCVCVCITLA